MPHSSFEDHLRSISYSVCSFNPPPLILYLSQSLSSGQHTLIPIERPWFFSYVETSEVPFLFSFLSRKKMRASFLFPTLGMLHLSEKPNHI